MKALLVTDNGREFITLESTDTKDLLQEIRDLVECDTLDAIYISDDLIGWVDDEGLFKDGNSVQTIAYVKNNQVVYANEIAGNIVVTSRNADGEILGLTDELRKDLNINLRVVI